MANYHTSGQSVSSKPTEADTCRKYVVPKLQAAGWDTEPHSIAEQRHFHRWPDRRGWDQGKRLERERLTTFSATPRISRLPWWKPRPNTNSRLTVSNRPRNTLKLSDLKFAYATNGLGIVEFDFLTGQERELDQFPTPDELWSRLTAGEGLSSEQESGFSRRTTPTPGNRPRYYQEIAINRAVKSILQGQRRNLLTMATGTGKTCVAFQICWKLWSSGWNRDGRFRKATHSVPGGSQHSGG